MKKQLAAMTMAMTMAASLIVPAGTAKAETTGAQDLTNPFVSKTAGQTVWDCIYFGNYWQTKYTPDNAPSEMQDDVVHTDTDGNKYLVREDGSCYRYEPIKWRVLKVSGNDAFLMADQNLDLRKYHDTELESIHQPAADWENCDLRAWLNGSGASDFLSVAFSAAEQEAIKVTNVKNEPNPWSNISSGADTQDQVYLLSVQEALTNAYGFSADPAEKLTRRSSNTNYAADGGTIKSDQGYNQGYWLRSSGAKEHRPAYVGLFLDAIILTEPTVHDNRQVGVMPVRPVMHVDLSDTSLWSYAGMVKADGSVWKEPAACVKTPAKPTIESVTSTKAKTAKVTLTKKVSGASGYQVMYAVNSKFSGAKTKKFTGTSVTLTNLSKKTWYFKVRAYKESGNKTVYSKWSGAKKASVKGSTTITYKTNEFTLQLPANWEGCYRVDKGETDGLPWYSFCDKQCYKELNGEGGWLFSIAVYKDRSYEDMPSYDVLMKKGNKIYVALYPTDVQFYGTSEKATKSYNKLSSQIDQVLKSMKLR